MVQQTFDPILANLPAGINTGSIQREWQAVTAAYNINTRHLPLPVWARRSLTETGPEAWDILQHDVGQMSPERDFCIYIHVPFCARRCRFCDCYSFKLGPGHDDHFTAYVDGLIQEMRLWGSLGTLSERRVSTVHLGGGTPTFLPPAEFRRLMQACRETFTTDSGTEWALESTSAQLTDEIVPVMDESGFTRLHVGVQSLEDAVRDRIHRQEPAVAVLDKIQGAIARGWIVSVDMIAGLPGQTLDGLLHDLRLLAGMGVDGFSLYEFQVSFRNRRFAEEFSLMDEPRLKKYLMIQVAGQQLDALGYHKTLFNHYGRERDMNLYFSFPERDEDCLALGTIADGVFGDYHYRHPTYAAYKRDLRADFPGLQGGLRRNAVENRLHDLTTALLSATIPESLLRDCVPADLLDRWLSARLLDTSETGCYTLTGSGSWFLGNMISELLESS